MLGFAQWCTAGLIAPLAGLGGATTAVPMAAVVVALAAVSLLALSLTALRGSITPRVRPSTP